MKLSLYKVALQPPGSTWTSTVKYVLASDYNEAAEKARTWEEEDRRKQDKEAGILNSEGDLIHGEKGTKAKEVKTIELLEEEVLI